MSKKLLSKEEQDALLELFESAKPETKNADLKQEKAAKPAGLGALKAELESEAVHWAAALESLIGMQVRITLQRIVKTSDAALGSEEVCYRLGQYPDRYLICTVSLVNLVNEKSLGSQEEAPMVLHPLTEIDKGLFENSGAVFSGGRALIHMASLPAGRPRIEALYNVDIAPLMRSKVRMVIDEPL